MPDKPHKSYAWPILVVGLIGGIVSYHAVISVAGYVLISSTDLSDQRREVETLQKENSVLWHELLSQPAYSSFNESNPPYDEGADAHADVAAARVQAVRDNEYLMVTFGANWCPDCRNLYKHLQSPNVTAYTRGLFSFAHVDVGRFNRNKDLAAELGVDLNWGIPVAIFFDPDGRLIGTTNDGQLEPARHYSSTQILMFLRDVADHSRILAPDAVRDAKD